MINVSKMDNRITIQHRTITIEKGIKKEVWTDYYSCWAELLDLYGQEKYSAYSVKLENSIKFKCRMCSDLKVLIGNTKDYRIMWNDEYYNLIFVDSMNGSKTEILLQVQMVS